MINIGFKLPMPIPAFILSIGVVFLLIAIAGKIKIPKFIEIPQVPTWGRVISGVAAVIFFFIGIVTLFPIPYRPPSIIIDEPRGEIYSTEKHVSITVRGRIENFSNELKKANIYVLVQPLKAEGIWIQKPRVPASERWKANAYLGGIGEDSAKNGDQFYIIAVATPQKLKYKYNTIQELPDNNNYISEPITLTVRRRQ